MSDDYLKELDEDFKDDPDYQALSHEEKVRIVNVLEKMMDLGMGAVYGDEENDAPDGCIECSKYINQCQAKCCSYIFALTKGEVSAGHIKYNQDRPYFIARDDDGLCPHLDRNSLQCDIWENRPLRCRRYDCSRDEEVMPEWINKYTKAIALIK